MIATTDVAPAVAPRSDRLRDHRLLLALSIALPLCEAVPLRYFRVTAGLAPQVTAAVPYGVYHDLRWVAVFNTSWWSFSLEIAALIAFRSALTAALVYLAWPHGIGRAPRREIIRAAAIYTSVAVVVLAPWATLAFAAGATSLSWLQFVALPVFLLFALALSNGAVPSPAIRFPTVYTVGWAISVFVVLNLASAVIVLGPWWLAWCSAGLAGLFNAWAWRGLVGSIATQRVRPGTTARAAVLLVTLAGVIAAGIALRLTWTNTRLTPRAVPFPADLHGRIPILVARGFDSSWSGDPVDLGLNNHFFVARFSYAGSSTNGELLTYDAAATHASVATADRLMNQQVETLHRLTGEPVRILAISEGAIVARSYVQAYPHAPVGRLVMASALVEPGRVYYPPPSRQGWGYATGWGLRGVSAVLKVLTGVSINPDMPFLRSIVDHAPALRTGMLCRSPDVPIAVSLPIASDASIPPIGAPQQVSVVIVPAFHGDDVYDAITALTSPQLPTDTGSAPSLLNRVLRAGATAWMVPELPVELNPQWRAPRTNASGCPVSGWPSMASGAP